MNVENQSHDTNHAMYQTQNIQLSNNRSTFIPYMGETVPTQTLDATPLVDQLNIRNKLNVNPSSSTHEIKTFELHSQTNTENQSQNLEQDSNRSIVDKTLDNCQMPKNVSSSVANVPQVQSPNGVVRTENVCQNIAMNIHNQENHTPVDQSTTSKSIKTSIAKPNQNVYNTGRLQNMAPNVVTPMQQGPQPNHFLGHPMYVMKIHWNRPTQLNPWNHPFHRMY